MSYTASQREAARRHLLASEPKLAGVVKQVGSFMIETEPDGYVALVHSIVNQQISTSAGRTIWGRLRDAAGEVTPRKIDKLEEAQLRAAGLSGQKVKYIRDLTAKVLDGTVDFRRMELQDDEEVIGHVTQVKGIGVWTAHMFLMFSLGRPDVFPWGDLGVRNALKRLYALRALPEQPKCERLARPWRPHGTAAAWYLWRSLDLPPIEES